MFFCKTILAFNISLLYFFLMVSNLWLIVKLFLVIVIIEENGESMLQYFSTSHRQLHWVSLVSGEDDKKTC